MKGWIFFILVIFFKYNLAIAASFNCQNATRAVELVICSDDELGELDIQLADAYAKALLSDVNVRNSQLAWLKQRDACEGKECIRSAYQRRLGELSAEQPAEDSTSSSQPAASIEGASLPASSATSVVQPQVTPESEIKEVESAPSSPALKVEQPISPPEHSPDGMREWLDNHMLGLIIGACVVLSFFTYGLSHRCPNCRKWFASKEVGSELLDQQTGFKTVTRRDEHRDKQGKLLKTVERKEQIKVTTSKHRNYYQCKHCSHQWSTVSTSQSE